MLETHDVETLPSPEATSSAEPLLPPGFQWGLVEIFGHRRHFGRVIEEERFGAKMLRVDVPTPDPGSDADPVSAITWATHYYGGAAVFSFTLTDEATVMRNNRPYVSPYAKRLPSPEPSFDVDEDDRAADDEIVDGISADGFPSAR